MDISEVVHTLKCPINSKAFKKASMLYNVIAMFRSFQSSLPPTFFFKVEFSVVNWVLLRPERFIFPNHFLLLPNNIFSSSGDVFLSFDKRKKHNYKYFGFCYRWYTNQQVTSYELRVNIFTSCAYCTSSESQVIFIARVTS